jgi:hypothetical protein
LQGPACQHRIATFRVARIEAAIRITRLRPSSTNAVQRFRYSIRHSGVMIEAKDAKAKTCFSHDPGSGYVVEQLKDIAAVMAVFRS